MDGVKQCERPGCERPAERVIHDHHFCGRHSYLKEEPPVVVCALDGCGRPATATVAGRAFCGDHARHFDVHGIPSGVLKEET